MLEFCQWLPVKHEQVKCASCGLSKPLVRHDFIYKDRCSDAPRCVGKRLRCSPRSGRGGCGATVRLRLADELPQRQYGIAQLDAFLVALIIGGSIEAAYCNATGALSARNGFRWLKRLYHKLPCFRTYLGPGAAGADRVLARSARLSILLSTLQRVLERTQEPSLAAFQCHCQASAL